MARSGRAGPKRKYRVAGGSHRRKRCGDCMTMDCRARELDELLRGKNSCLRKFRDLSRAFAGRAGHGDLTGLAEFELRRESILKAIALFDRKIDFVVPEIRE